MALKPIYGLGGFPALDFAGEIPVAMEDPNPHADWDFVNDHDYPHEATVTVNPGYVILSPVYPFSVPAVYVDIFMSYDGNRTIGLSLSWSSKVAYCSADCRRIVEGEVVGGSGGIVYLTSWVSTSGNFAVPYYRYRLRVVISASGPYLKASDWVKLTITLS